MQITCIRTHSNVCTYVCTYVCMYVLMYAQQPTDYQSPHQTKDRSTPPLSHTLAWFDLSSPVECSVLHNCLLILYKYTYTHICMYVRMCMHLYSMHRTSMQYVCICVACVYILRVYTYVCTCIYS